MTDNAVIKEEEGQELPATSAMRQLPMEIVTSKKIKIGNEIYNLDRNIRVPDSSVTNKKEISIKLEETAAAEPTTKEPAPKKIKIEDSSNTVQEKKPPDQITSTSVKEEKPADRKDTQELFLEIKWFRLEWVKNKNDKKLEEFNFSMFADDIPKSKGFKNSRVFAKKNGSEQGENHEYILSFCLVDSKEKDRKTLVEIDTWYWTVPINLMHFNILSQDLANFCRTLWRASGRKMDLYCDMAIEFGESKYSTVTIASLVKKATGMSGLRHVMYFRTAKLDNGATKEHSEILIKMIFETCPAIVISYEEDFSKLGIKTDDIEDIGFWKLRDSNVYVGPG